MIFYMDSYIRKLKKLVKTDNSEGSSFLKGTKPEHIDYLLHNIKTFKKYTPDELKPHINKILKSKTARIAKKRLIESNDITGGGIFDFVKKIGSSTVNMAKDLGNNIVNKTSSFFDKAVPMAKKGFELAKPYIKQYAPEAVSFGVSHIPAIGPTVAPIAKQGTKWLLNKLF